MKLLLKSLALFLGLAIASPALAFSYNCSDWDYDDVEWEAHVLFWKKGTPASIADCIHQISSVMGFAVTERDDDGSTPLHYAARWNDDPMVIMALLEAGADVNATDAEALTPLHLASSSHSNLKVINTLIMAGADVDARDTRGETPLHKAAQSRNNFDVIMALIGAGADGSLKEYYWDMTPFDFAKRNYGVGSNIYRILDEARFR